MKAKKPFSNVIILLTILALITAGCQGEEPQEAEPVPTDPVEATERAPEPEEEAEVEIEMSVVLPDTFSIDSNIPGDISDLYPGVDAPDATLEQASVFAWKEFIALNWPADIGTPENPTRETPSDTVFGSEAPVLVWHTFRNKIEIYPGTGAPSGYDASSADLGYNTYPQYAYDPGSVNTADGTITTPCVGSGTEPPPPMDQPVWVNLDENDEIGLNSIFAGVVSSGDRTTQGDELVDRIMFAAKANSVEYNYYAQNQWWDPNNTFLAAQTATKAYLPANNGYPDPDSTDLISFPSGTIEIITGWRQLTDEEMNSGRFYTTTVRYYVGTGEDKTFYNGFTMGNPPYCYIDAVWGMVGLHIIQKTPTAPYFTFATFGQADNILLPDVGADGQPVSIEDADGNIINSPANTNSFEPNITSKNAAANTPQVLTADPMADSNPGYRLWYRNTATFTGLPQEIISVNQREHPIPQEVIDVNAAVHNAINNYSQDNGLGNSPWLYYKLVNIQYVPIVNPNPGTRYTGADAATYYLANIVVETDYNLAVFSGKFASSPGLITDFNSDGSPFFNVYHDKTGINMGGCMGCHGNAAVGGTDSSFILAGALTMASSSSTGPDMGIYANRQLAPQSINLELPDLGKFNANHGQSNP